MGGYYGTCKCKVIWLSRKNNFKIRNLNICSNATNYYNRIVDFSIYIIGGYYDKIFSRYTRVAFINCFNGNIIWTGLSKEDIMERILADIIGLILLVALMVMIFG